MGEVELCLGFVDDGGWSQDYCRRCIEPRWIIVSSYPTSWAYSRNIQSHTHYRTTNTTDNWYNITHDIIIRSQRMIDFK